MKELVTDTVSSLYLAGNKRSLLKDILPHFQDDSCKVLVEPFLGTGVVSLASAKNGLFEQYYGNDMEWWIVGLHNKMKDKNFLKEVETLNKIYANNETAFLALRDKYNKGGCTDYAELFTLMLRANSNRVRFSGKEGKWKHNVPYGDRNPFNLARMEEHNRLCQNLEVTQGSFGFFLDNLDKKVDWNEVVVYLDPPYQNGKSNGGAVYNSGWSLEMDTALLEYVLDLREKGAKIVMSNTFENRGYVFQLLIDWCEKHSDKFDVYHLNKDYGNSAHVKVKKGSTDEVLIVSK
ncbi:hypothetical protein KUA24_140 [Vibrio phage HNL01]|nr:hypothetical protein KUA24_140 [Vibrio phage HNL01]